MSGCLDHCQWPDLEWLQLHERRNTIASIVSGTLVGVLFYGDIYYIQYIVILRSGLKYLCILQATVYQSGLYAQYHAMFLLIQCIESIFFRQQRK